MLFALATATIAFATPACHMAPTDPQYATYSQNASATIRGPLIVNLDLPPKQRWSGIVGPAASEIKAMIAALKAEGGVLTEALFALLEKAFGSEAQKLLAAMPEEYAGEIEGIQEATGISALDVFVMNIMYELSGACTSVVAQDASGRVYHGRNLDFGSGSGLTTSMRPTLRTLHFQRNGSTLFESVTFLGYVGCLTCVKPGAFSASVDTRIWAYSGGLPKELVAWILGLDRSGHFLTFMTRDAFEHDANYAEAVQRFNTTKLLGPAYVIAAGVNSGEGAVFTRSATESLHFWSLADEMATSGNPWVLETNYDHWDGKPHDRRDNGNACMAQTHAAGAIGFAGLFQVLSSQPTRNSATTYTALVSPAEARLEAYVQYA